jgi:hypothetical protein
MAASTIKKNITALRKQRIFNEWTQYMKVRDGVYTRVDLITQHAVFEFDGPYRRIVARMQHVEHAVTSLHGARRTFTCNIFLPVVIMGLSYE